MNISSDLKLNEALSLFILPSRFIGAQTLFYFTLGQCKTLCSENVFTDALSGNSLGDLPVLTSCRFFLLLLFTFTQYAPSHLISPSFCP